MQIIQNDGCSDILKFSVVVCGRWIFFKQTFQAQKNKNVWRRSSRFGCGQWCVFPKINFIFPIFRFILLESFLMLDLNVQNINFINCARVQECIQKSFIKWIKCYHQFFFSWEIRFIHIRKSCNFVNELFWMISCSSIVIISNGFLFTFNNQMKNIIELLLNIQSRGKYIRF